MIAVKRKKDGKIMNKKVIIGIVAVALVAIIGVGGYFLLNNSNKTNETEKTPSNNPVVNENNNDKNNETTKDIQTPISNGKTLVVYYSASGSTKKSCRPNCEKLKCRFV